MSIAYGKVFSDLRKVFCKSLADLLRGFAALRTELPVSEKHLNARRSEKAIKNALFFKNKAYFGNFH